MIRRWCCSLIVRIPVLVIISCLLWMFDGGLFPHPVRLLFYLFWFLAFFWQFPETNRCWTVRPLWQNPSIQSMCIFVVYLRKHTDTNNSRRCTSHNNHRQTEADAFVFVLCCVVFSTTYSTALQITHSAIVSCYIGHMFSGIKSASPNDDPSSDTSLKSILLVLQSHRIGSDRILFPFSLSSGQYANMAHTWRF